MEQSRVAGLRVNVAGWGQMASGNLFQVKTILYINLIDCDIFSLY